MVLSFLCSNFSFYFQLLFLRGEKKQICSLSCSTCSCIYACNNMPYVVLAVHFAVYVLFGKELNTVNNA